MLARKSLHIIGAFLLLLLLVLLTFTIGPAIEARFWPVVDNVYVTVEDRTETGITVLLSYTKHRDCEWRGVAWYFGRVRVPIDFRVEEQFVPRSRTIGEHLVGPYTIKNIQQLEGTRAEIYHRCHPFWPVHNPLYPPKETWTRQQHTKLPGIGGRYVQRGQPE